MHYLTQSKVIPDKNYSNSFLKGILFCLYLLILIINFRPVVVYSALETIGLESQQEYVRSLESLRDINNDFWQLAVYPKIGKQKTFILRIVGYPATLRLDHPENMKVHSGRKEWEIRDITMLNPQLAKDSREAVAEFDLTPVLNEIKTNKALRFSLDKVFADLPIPPYLIREWREVAKNIDI